MTIDISKLTDKHRVKVRFNPSSEVYEMGLYLDGWMLRLNSGHGVRWLDDGSPGVALGASGSLGFEILEVIDPPFEPHWGMVVGSPRRYRERLVYLPDEGSDRPWLGMTSHLLWAAWHSTEVVQDLIKEEGWEVMTSENG